MHKREESTHAQFFPRSVHCIVILVAIFSLSLCSGPSLKDLFERVDNRNIVDFTRKANFNNQL